MKAGRWACLDFVKLNEGGAKSSGDGEVEGGEEGLGSKYEFCARFFEGLDHLCEAGWSMKST